MLGRRSVGLRVKVVGVVARNGDEPQYTQVDGWVADDNLDEDEEGDMWIQPERVLTWSDESEEPEEIERGYRFSIGTAAGSDYQLAGARHDDEFLFPAGHVVELEEIDDGALSPYRESGVSFETADVSDIAE